jgi:2-C-methyl-D-erythritol 2,4-cyclodiphosphate synthase
MRFLGVLVSADLGLEGFSDGDALSHSVADALLGAAGLDDIGTHFPAGKTRFKGMTGVDLLAQTVTLLRKKGWKPLQVDSVVWLEYPALAPHLAEIRKRLGKVLGVVESAVSVKPKRGEGLGFVGRGQGIAVWAVAVVTPAKHDSGMHPLSAELRKPGERRSRPILGGKAVRRDRSRAPPSTGLRKPGKPRAEPSQSAPPTAVPPEGVSQAIVYIDGGADPNPGPGAAGMLILRDDGTAQKAGKFLGSRVTNNEAEYRALLWALDEAKQLGIKDLEIRSDSELLVFQILGRYRVRQAHLQRLSNKARQKIAQFRKFRITAVPREENYEADREVAKALSAHK